MVLERFTQKQKTGAAVSMTSFFKNAQQRRTTVTSNVLCFVTFNQSGAPVSREEKNSEKAAETMIIPCFRGCDNVWPM